MSDAIINKVAESGLITLDLETLYPTQEVAPFDIKNFLFMGMILKEKEFRAALSNQNWDEYKNKHVAIFCSADAIIPMWAYMLVATNLSIINATALFGTPDEARNQLFSKNIEALNPNEFIDQRVVVKGCGDRIIGEFAYVQITTKLAPIVKSLMFGEPCSTVPVYKRK